MKKRLLPKKRSPKTTGLQGFTGGDEPSVEGEVSLDGKNTIPPVG
jgi:hypothetical protein